MIIIATNSIDTRRNTAAKIIIEEKSKFVKKIPQKRDYNIKYFALTTTGRRCL